MHQIAEMQMTNLEILLEVASQCAFQPVIKYEPCCFRSTALYRFIINGNKFKILDLLEQHDINAKIDTYHGDTVLHLAFKNIQPVQSKIIEILDIFITRGADPNITNNREETVLHLAIANNMKDVVDYLIKNNARIDKTDKKGNSLAHFFIKSEYEKFMTVSKIDRLDYIFDCRNNLREKESSDFAKWLIYKGFNFDSRNNNGKSALHLAIEYNLQFILPTLLEHTYDLDFFSRTDKRTLLHLYFNERNVWKKRHFGFFRYNEETLEYAIEVVRMIIDRGVPCDAEDQYGFTVLYAAVDMMEDIELVDVLLEESKNVKEKGGVLLLHAVVKKLTSKSPNIDYYMKILCTLLNKGADVNSEDICGVTAATHAIIGNNLDVIKLMKKYGADLRVVTREGQNLLHVLAGNLGDGSQDDIFDILISEGCDANARDKNNLTPLYVAIDKNNIAVIRKLLKHGVNIHNRDRIKRWTPLQLAVTKKNGMEVVELLLDYGAKINGDDRWDDRPIYLANGIDMLTLLLQRGAEVNARDEVGKTALYKALCNGRITDAKKMLEFGADINDNCIVKLLPALSRIFMWHWIKMDVAKLPCSNKYARYASSIIYEQLRLGCLEEINELKSTMIDHRTSLYSWLRMDPNRRYIYTLGDKLRNLVESPILLKETFTYYATLILARYNETITRKALIEPAKEIWYVLTKIRLPDVCIERIIAHLSNADLLDMVEFGDRKLMKV